MKYIILIISIVLTFLVAFTGSGYFSFLNFSFKSIFSIVIFIPFTYYTVILAKKKNKSVYVCLFSLILPPTIILIYLLFEFERTAAAFPSKMAYLIGIIIGILLTKFKSVSFRVGILIFCVILFYSINKVLYPSWIHKVNYDTYFGNIKPVKTSFNLNGFDENKTPIHRKHFENKVLILNFWFEGCGYCKIQFPDFKKLAEQFHSPDTLFIAVNYPLRGTPTDKTLNYFNVEDSKVNLLFPKDTSIFTDNRSLKYPSYMVINSKNEEVFYGGIDMLEKFLRK